MRRIRYYLTLPVALLFFACGSDGVKDPETSQPGAAQERVFPPAGLSLLAIQNKNYSCDWLRAFDGLPEISVALLWGSFGDRVDCLALFLSDPRPAYLRVYLHNGPCERKGNCAGADRRNPFRSIEAKAVDAIELVQMYGVNVKLQLVIGLEDNFTDNVAELFCQRLKGITDHEVWRNPNKASYLADSNCFDGYELHWQEREADAARFRADCGFSNDGYDIEGFTGGEWALPYRITKPALLDEIRHRKRECFSYIWHARTSNCLTDDSSGAEAPYNRRCNVDHNAFRELNVFLKEIENERNYTETENSN